MITIDETTRTGGNIEKTFLRQQDSYFTNFLDCYSRLEILRSKDTQTAKLINKLESKFDFGSKLIRTTTIEYDEEIRQ